MSPSFLRRAGLGLILTVWGMAAEQAQAQPFGIELQNTLMPASGGMAGVSIARPQDLTSAINANPATLTQFRGTQFTFSGAWAEPTFNMTQTDPIVLLGVDPYSAKSTAPGVPAGNIGVTQDLSAFELPITFGIGFISASGCLADFRQVPQSNGTNAAMVVFSLPVAVGIDVTERLSVGASLGLGIAFFDAPFADLGGMTPDYALRATFGANYLVNADTTLGAYYQTEQAYQFDNAVRFGIDPPGVFRDVFMDLPQNLGIGISNQSLADGNLLLAADFTYKIWEDAQLFKAVYHNQFVVQLGAQYTSGRYRLRAGYAWAENPLKSDPEAAIGGIAPPGGIPAVRYTQGLLAVTSQHRISAGVGIRDVLPGLDMDLMAGGMFRDREQVGASTSTAIASYWIGTGLTWRFNTCPCAAPAASACTICEQ